MTGLSTTETPSRSLRISSSTQQLMAAAHRLEVGLAVPKHMPRRYEGAEFWPIPSALKFVVGSSNQTNELRTIRRFEAQYTARRASSLLQEHVLNKNPGQLWTRLPASDNLIYIFGWKKTLFLVFHSAFFKRSVSEISIYSHNVVLVLMCGAEKTL